MVKALACQTLSDVSCVFVQVIILIGNKADLEAQRDVTYEEAKQFAEENGEWSLWRVIRSRFESWSSSVCLHSQVCCSWRPAPKRELFQPFQSCWRNVCSKMQYKFSCTHYWTIHVYFPEAQTIESRHQLSTTNSAKISSDIVIDKIPDWMSHP